MGSDLRWLGEDLMRASHPRLMALLSRIATRLVGPISADERAALVDEINRELQNASIR